MRIVILLTLLFTSNIYANTSENREKDLISKFENSFELSCIFKRDSIAMTFPGMVPTLPIMYYSKIYDCHAPLKQSYRLKLRTKEQGIYDHKTGQASIKTTFYSMKVVPIGDDRIIDELMLASELSRIGTFFDTKCNYESSNLVGTMLPLDVVSANVDGISNRYTDVYRCSGHKVKVKLELLTSFDEGRGKRYNYIIRGLKLKL